VKTRAVTINGAMSRGPARGNVAGSRTGQCRGVPHCYALLQKKIAFKIKVCWLLFY